MYTLSSLSPASVYIQWKQIHTDYHPENWREKKGIKYSLTEM